jgi:hypothetical protein
MSKLLISPNSIIVCYLMIYLTLPKFTENTSNKGETQKNIMFEKTKL